MRSEPVSDRWSPVPRAIPLLWLSMSAVWAAVIVVTDQLAWPLALWIATTVGPLTAARAHYDRRPVVDQRPDEPTHAGAPR